MRKFKQLSGERRTEKLLEYAEQMDRLEEEANKEPDYELDDANEEPRFEGDLGDKGNAKRAYKLASYGLADELLEGEEFIDVRKALVDERSEEYFERWEGKDREVMEKLTLAAAIETSDSVKKWMESYRNQGVKV